MSALDPTKFSISSGIRGGRQKVAKAQLKGLAGALRVEMEPTLGLVAGVSGYFGRSGPNAGDLFDAAGAKLDLDVDVAGVGVDARWLWRGLELRALFTTFFLSDTAALRGAVDATGAAAGADVGSQLLGGYAEIAWDALSLCDTEHQLLPFFRFESFDTAFALEGRGRDASDDAQAVTDLVFGLGWRPVSAVVFKGDVTLRSRGGDGADETQMDLGVGFMF